jgi:bifunctional oligoribonuclease and PAP phosphatase NrnA
MTSLMAIDPGGCRRVCTDLRRHQHIVLTSHVRPDGDSLGSALALAWALQAIGKDARVIMRDRAPVPIDEFPGVGEIEVAATVPDATDAVVVLECGDLERTGLTGLDRFHVINVDHHPGNTGYGAVQWFDGSAAACAELVFEIIAELGVPLTPDMATQMFVAIVTDTGSFRYPGVSPRTFGISARLLEAGADPVAVARKLFDGNSLGRLRLQGAVLQTMELFEAGRVATLHLDVDTLAATGAEPEETDGLINLPLSVKAVHAVVFFKQVENSQYRISLRSKGDIDVGRVARSFGGGGHKNASGCTLSGTLEELRAQVFERLLPEMAPRPATAAGDGA